MWWLVVISLAQGDPFIIDGKQRVEVHTYRFTEELDCLRQKDRVEMKLQVLAACLTQKEIAALLSQR
jgi:hypothetical protein